MLLGERVSGQGLPAVGCSYVVVARRVFVSQSDATKLRVPALRQMASFRACPVGGTPGRCSSVVWSHGTTDRVVHTRLVSGCLLEVTFHAEAVRSASDTKGTSGGIGGACF